jgi:hypothetical protein
MTATAESKARFAEVIVSQTTARRFPIANFSFS